jgi:hypothetical protein
MPVLIYFCVAMGPDDIVTSHINDYASSVSFVLKRRSWSSPFACYEVYAPPRAPIYMHVNEVKLNIP